MGNSLCISYKVLFISRECRKFDHFHLWKCSCCRMVEIKPWKREIVYTICICKISFSFRMACMGLLGGPTLCTGRDSLKAVCNLGQICNDKCCYAPVSTASARGHCTLDKACALLSKDNSHCSTCVQVSIC